MQYQDFRNKIFSHIFPNGVPENMLPQLNNYLTEGYVQVQQVITCLTGTQPTIIPHCATNFHCGTTVFDAPSSRLGDTRQIQQIKVIDGDWCNPITYLYQPLRKLKCWQSDNWAKYEQPTQPVDTPDLGMGFKYPYSNTDSPDRAYNGIWSMEPQGQIDAPRIWIAPWIQSSESVVVYSKGIKWEFDDLDEVPDRADLMKCLREYVWAEYDKDFQGGSDFSIHYQSYQRALMDLKVKCRDSQVNFGLNEDACSQEASNAWLSSRADADTTVNTSIDFAVIADFGGDADGYEADETTIAALIAALDPEFIVTAGDNNYPSGAASTITQNITDHYGAFIDADPDLNRFWPAFGNHDLDTTIGQPLLDYMDAIPKTISNGRIYTITRGPVQFFFLSSGYNTGGDLVEPLGNDDTSAQKDIIEFEVNKSTAIWKIAIMHHPVHSSDAAYSPGYPDLYWVEGMFDLVVAGHAHVYERLKVNGQDYINCTSGGGEVRTFTTPVAGSLFREAFLGYLQASVECDTLTVNAIDDTGAIKDTLILTK